MEYILKLDEKDLDTISAGLVEIPWKLANPLLAKLHVQVTEQKALIQKPDLKAVEG